MPSDDLPTKAQAETRKAVAEAGKAVAEAGKLRAEREHLQAQARSVTAMAQEQEIALRSKQRLEQITLAQDEYHHTYVFDDEVTDATVKRCITYLGTWSRQEPGCPIELQINTPGGSIFAGLALIDYLRDLRKRPKPHTVTAVAYGMAASMGAVILQAADVRAMGANSFLLLHEGNLFAGGEFGHVEDNLKMMGKLHDRILDLFAERANISKAQIRNKWKRKDWWVDSSEALRNGFVDEVR